MKTRMWLAWGLLIWNVNLGACSITQPRPEVHYYTLTLTVPETPGPRKLSLGVRPINARAPYDQERIVYRSSAYTFDLYNYHRWASSPGEQVTTWTRRYLRSGGLFAHVLPTSGSKVDLILEGTVQQFEEIDLDNTWQAALSIDFWLVRPGESTPIWFQSYSATQQAIKRNPEAIAESMSHGLENILSQLSTDLLPVVTQTTP